MSINFEKYVVEKGLMKLAQYKTQCNWIPTYGFVSHLIRQIEAKSVLEIGVAYGYHAEFLLQEHPSIEYFGVDPYQSNYDPSDAFSADVTRLFPEIPGRSMDFLYSCVHTNLIKHLGRGTLLRKKSAHAASYFADGSLDVVYIDGDHRPEQVLIDLESWFSKVRLGGIICGDDYNWPGSAEVISKFFDPLKCPIIGYADNTGTLVKWSVVKMPVLA
jgi:hypothetical protein